MWILSHVKAEREQVTSLRSGSSICCTVRQRIYVSAPSPDSLFSGQPPSLLGEVCCQISIMTCTPQRPAQFTAFLFLAVALQHSSRKSQIPNASVHSDINFLLNSAKLVSNTGHRVHCHMLGWPDTSVNSGVGLVSPAAQHAGNITLIIRLVINDDKADMGTLSKHPQRRRGSFIASLGD